MMTDKDKIIKAIKCRAERNKHCGNPCEETGNCHYAKCVVGLDGESYYPFVCDTEQLCTDALAMLKEQEELLRKLQNDKDKLCLEVSKWKHKFHDAPPKFVSQGVVDQICWERDTALSQLEQIGKGLGSKMDDIVALLKEQDAVKCPTDHDNELTRHVLSTARQHVEECLNKARVRYAGKTAEFLMFAKGIRDACWAIDELISTHNEGTEQNDE